MSVAVAMRLGRVSNLPTVWTNALAGTVLAGGDPWTLSALLAALGLSLLYVSGMYLNDAFDRDIDAAERPTRPIPANLVATNTVFAAGFALMLAGLTFVLWASAVASPPTGWRPVLAGLALGGAIVFYDWHHKGNRASPFFMGLCRVLAYLTAGYAAVAAPSPMLYLAAAVSLSYLIGLTFVAKQEALDRLSSLWPLLFLTAPIVYGLVRIGQAGALGGLLLLALAAWVLTALFFLKRRAKGDVPRAVVGLIAGIALLDALFLAYADALAAAGLAAVCFLSTLALQRWVSGT
ncbi:MAG: UbiA family prenyltransferase [Hyphomicrobiaceae bacterium]